jgi:hypothetical protein
LSRVAAALAAVLASVASVAFVAPDAGQATAPPTPAQQLVSKYTPIVMVRAQNNGPCDNSEEQYRPPTSVDAVLGNPRVRLLEHDSHGTRVIKPAPTAADLANRGPSYYMDLPGNPLNAGCRYARDFASLRRGGRAPAVTYAHIAREPRHAGFALRRSGADWTAR